jgi:hypothetical protein
MTRRHVRYKAACRASNYEYFFRAFDAWCPQTALAFPAMMLLTLT